MITKQELEALKAKHEHASEVPWAYELTGDKCNSWGIGILVDANEQPIAGEAVEPFEEETGEFGERPIVVEPICTGEDHISNAVLITSLVNAFPDLYALARFALHAREFLNEHGIALSAGLGMYRLNALTDGDALARRALEHLFAELCRESRSLAPGESTTGGSDERPKP